MYRYDIMQKDFKIFEATLGLGLSRIKKGIPNSLLTRKGKACEQGLVPVSQNFSALGVFAGPISRCDPALVHCHLTFASPVHLM